MGRKSTGKRAHKTGVESTPALTGSGATPRPLFPGAIYVHAGAFVLLVAATFLLYARDLDLGFFPLDDPTYVGENPWIRELSFANISHLLSHPYFANYAPVH